jgi:hypothetical protein
MKGFSLVTAILLACPCLAAPAAALPQESQAGEVQLIRSLDGGKYEPHRADLIEKAQEALKEKGFYACEINGILGEATMKSIGEFQEEHGLMVSDVPLPKARELLFEEWRFSCYGKEEMS